MSNLNDKQKAFCREYIVDFNKKQAAVRAGYSKDTARQSAYRLFTNVYIQQEIKRLIEKRNIKIDVKEDEIIAELKKIAYADIGEYIKLIAGEVNLDEVDSSLIHEMHTTVNEKTGKKQSKIKLHDKLKALELLGRYKAMFTDNIQHGGEIKTSRFDLSKLSDEEIRAFKKLMERVNVQNPANNPDAG